MEANFLVETPENILKSEKFPEDGSKIFSRKS